MVLDGVVPLVDAFAAQRAALVGRITRLVERDLAGFDGWYSDRLVSELAAQVAAKVLTGQTGIGNLTDAYLSRVTTLVAERTISPAGASPDLGRSLRLGQADLGEVYVRLGADFRWRRSQGVDEAAARSATTTRATVMADTDMGLAFRRQVVDFNQRRGVLRFRRVIRSEGPCGLCLAASDRLYSRGDLMPIHGRCRCGVMPVTMASDPGSTLTNDDLPALYEAAGGTSGEKLKQVRVVQHGELGPVLVARGEHFRGPLEVAAA